MRVYRLSGPGKPLKLVDEPELRPGPGQVLIDLKAATLNYRDTLMQDAQYGSSQKPDLIPLSDGAGIVSAVGAHVAETLIGQRVAIGFMPNWVEGPFSMRRHAAALGGGFVDGVLAERIVVPASGITPIPSGWTFEEAASYPCAGVTAWVSLFGGRGLRPGETVLVQGTGGVSIFALQLARAAGARVIATSRSDEKLAALRARGAEGLINYKKVEDWGVRAAEMAGGEGVDIVVDVGGPGTLDQSLHAVRPGGEVAVVGVLTGFSGPVNLGAILSKRINVRGIYVGSVADLRDSMASGIRPVIDSVFAFEKANEAYAHMRSGAHSGKIAIKIAD
jgi:NADPH:quinone reductase-like Zn-dependent oxidoreductase